MDEGICAAAFAHVSALVDRLVSSAEAETIKARRRDERQQQIDRVFKDYQDWLDNTQTLEDKPYIQIAAVLTGMDAW